MKPGWLGAAHAVESTFAREQATSVRLFLDAGVAGTAVQDRVQRWLSGLGASPRTIETVVLPAGGPDLAGPLLPGAFGSAAALDTEPLEPVVTVAVGGGGLLDRVKLATRDPDPRAWAGTRSGLLVLPPGAGRRTTLVAVPTTLGTGAEASAVAVATLDGRRLLVMDRGLRPQAFAHDAEAYLGLPHQLVREGLAEILSRLVGPFVGDAVGDPLTDAVCLAAVDRLVRCADAVTADLDAGRTPSLATLAEVARIGALGHSDALQRPHAPWSVKLWAIANEAAAATAGRKMPVTAHLWPAFWAAVDDGVGALGDPLRLRRLWASIRSADTNTHRLPAAPGPGIAALLRRWGVSPDHGVDGLDPLTLAERVVLAWGAGLPPLHDVTMHDITRVLLPARAGPPSQPVTSAVPS